MSQQAEHQRQLISYEIHDGIAQYIFAAIMQLEAFKADATCGHEEDNYSNVNEALRLLREAAEETRSLISGLRPPTLEELGIIGSLNQLFTDSCSEFKDVTFLHDIGSSRLPPQIEVVLFRISQESLTNIRRHAKAKHIRVELKKTEQGNLSLVIKDDGRGFDPKSTTKGHFGLEGIRQRALYLGGAADIQSAPGLGTTIHVQLPASAIQNKAS